jgi:Smg protein
MMTMVSLIADQVQNKQELFDEEGRIMQALLNNGYRLHEADAALTLMQTLVQKQSEGLFPAVPDASRAGMRAMNREERHRFTLDAFGFVIKLASLGIISEDQREDLLERAMALYAERIDLDHLKNLVAYTLFFSRQEQDADAHEAGRRIRDTSWN